MYNITFIIVSEQILFLAVVVSDVVCATIATDVELKELIKEYCCKHKCLFSFCIFSIGSLSCHNFLWTYLLWIDAIWRQGKSLSLLKSKCPLLCFKMFFPQEFFRIMNRKLAAHHQINEVNAIGCLQRLSYLPVVIQYFLCSGSISVVSRYCLLPYCYGTWYDIRKILFYWKLNWG